MTKRPTTFTRVAQIAVVAIALTSACAAPALAQAKGEYISRDYNPPGGGARSQMQGPHETRPPSTPLELTTNEMHALLANGVPGLNRNSPEVEALFNALGNKTVSAQMGQAGRFVASQMGVGSCTRHFYNNTDSYWAVAMINSGHCHVDGEEGPDKPVCMIPPRKVATLKYRNAGTNSNITNAGIAIAGAAEYKRYAQYFRLRIIGCYIEHRGNTGYASLNSPADGDVDARW
jgi:hypothetical protein